MTSATPPPAPGLEPFEPVEPFEAIASPVRRRILDILVEGDRPVNDIVSHFELSRPAISQHLRILLAAGLVAQQRQGREQRYRLVPENLEPVRDWIAHYERFWDAHFNRLRHYLDKRSAASAALHSAAIKKGKR